MFSVPDLPACLVSLWDQIPPGRVATCGDLADALGDRIAARWVGHFSLHHAHDDRCPCHRIVRADGSLGGYVSGNVRDKSRRLKSEGIAVRRGAVGLAEHRFTEFTSDRPLVTLRRLQESVVGRISPAPPRTPLKLVAGVDTSYTAAGDAVAAYVLVDIATGEVLWKTVLHRPVRFPYVSSYLSFRELPLLVELLEEAERQGRRADVVVVDGTGILHPRRAGIAAHLGVLGRRPTIGLTKKLLCGSVDLAGIEPMQSRPVLLDGDPLGVALRPTAGSRRPLFVSPGHRMDLSTAETVVLRLLRGRRLPEPLYWADRLSRQAAREA